MSTRRLVKSAIDWTKFSRSLPDNQKEIYRLLKGKSDGFVGRIQELPEKLAPIDWEYYNHKIDASNLVGQFKKSYETLEVPYPKDKDNVAGKIDTEGRKLKEKIKSANGKLQQQIHLSRSFIGAVDKYIPDPLSTTADELVEFFPHEKPDFKRPIRWPYTPQQQPGMVENEAR